MTDTPPDTAQPPSQVARRTRFAGLLLIAAVAALGIVVVLNLLVDLAVREADPAVNSWVRYDLTATRRYSLSPQTQQVLASLDKDHTIVRLFAAQGAEEIERVVELIDEYPRYSSRLTVEDINPATDFTGLDSLAGRVTQAFEGEVEPIRAAIENARAAAKQLLAAYTDIGALLRTNAEENQLGQGTAAEVNRFVLNTARLYATDLDQQEEAISAQLEQPLPDLSAIRTLLTQTLGEQADNQLPRAAQVLELAAQDPQASDAARERFLRATNLVSPVIHTVRQAVIALEDAPTADRYARVAATIRNNQALIVLSDDEVQAIDITELYREVPDEAAEQQGRLNLGFIGEEKITGVLASMQWEHPPLVVFVYDEVPATGPRGEYSMLASRLNATGFAVEQWSPRGTPMPGQFGMPGRTLQQPPPEPQPGQPAVWVVLPPTPQDPRNPVAAAEGPPRQPVADLLTRRLAMGDAAFFLFAINPAASFDAADPVRDLAAERFGIEPRLDAVAVYEVYNANRQPRPDYRFVHSRWNPDFPVSQAVQGMTALFTLPSPIDLAEVEGVEQHTLVDLAAPRSWLIDDFSSLQNLGEAEYDPEAAFDRLTIAVAAERPATEDAPAQRVAAVAEPVWAIDDTITLGPFGPGTAEMFGAQFPGNGELFVNTVYWLAGVDELIAPTPRSQDVRRVGDVSPTSRWVVAGLLMLGLPLLATAGGVAVTIFRRMG
ncbi:MAG: Gldg family protein [Planctomycetota bacterium]